MHPLARQLVGPARIEERRLPSKRGGAQVGHHPSVEARARLVVTGSWGGYMGEPWAHVVTTECRDRANPAWYGYAGSSPAATS
jgi:hypothetical protein